MVKTLKKVGNGYALAIDRAMMEAMNITPATPLMLTINEGRLTVVPANVGFSEAEVEQFFGRIRPEYDGMLQRLAE